MRQSAIASRLRGGRRGQRSSRGRSGRNTGPRFGTAALRLLRDDPDALLLVRLSDHVSRVHSTRSWGDAARRGKRQDVTSGNAALTRERALATLPIGEGGFRGVQACNGGTGLVEKPSLDRAQALVTAAMPIGPPAISLMRAERDRRGVPGAGARDLLPRCARARGTERNGEAGSWLPSEAAFRRPGTSPRKRSGVRADAVIAPWRPWMWPGTMYGAWSAVTQHRAEKARAGNVLGKEVMAIETRILAGTRLRQS